MKLVKDEGIKYTDRYMEPVEMDKGYVKRAIEFVLEKIDDNLDSFTYHFPDYGGAQCYKKVDNDGWVASFWTGMVWLAYEVTGDKKYMHVAQIHNENFRKRIDERIEINTHDLGFLYSLSCVANHRLTGNEEAKKTAIKAADHLITRYHEKARIIQAWGDPKDPEQRGRMIIDCNMNLPLLYWAYEVTGDKNYYNIAYNHIRQAAKYIVREDASTFHTFFMDTETGEPRYGKTHQGYSDESCWARGQAWGIYGFPLSYKYTHDYSLIELAKKVTNYFINRLPEDDVCYWDLIFTEGSEEKDSSAAAITACGILELARYLPLSDPYKRIYENIAIKIIKSLNENYTSKGHPYSNAVLLHGVGNKPGNFQIDEPLIYGDYFYFEALVRLYKDWNQYW